MIASLRSLARGLALAVALAPALLAAGSDGTPPRRPAALVAVQRGWARVATVEGVRLLAPGDPALAIPGAFAVEVGGASRATLSLPERASLRLEDGAQLSVEPRVAGALRLDVDRVGGLELEVRGGATTVVLPRGQVLRPGVSALRLDAAGDSVDLWHRAGAVLELDLGGRYPFDVQAGTRARLPERIGPQRRAR